jgi:hypothetical protein
MKRTLVLAALIFGAAQFIRPDTTVPDGNPALDVITLTQPDTEVASLLRTACYDCHSNETVYPWYDRITPVNWWVQHHVDEARAEGDLSRWGELPEKKRRHFAEEAVQLITEGEMPLPSYTFMHPEAELTAGQREVLSAFFRSLR